MIGVREGGRLVGLAPLYVVRDDEESLGMLLGTGNSDYLDVLGEADIAPVLADIDCQMWDLQQLRPSSPLLRARESAAIAAEVLGTMVRIDPRLAERGFGELELTSDEHYERVWSEDRLDPAHEKWGVESTTAIIGRVTGLLRELHDADTTGTFLLCTHGDVASVLLCAAGGVALSQHRDVGAMANGEVRPISALTGLSGFPRG